VGDPLNTDGLRKNFIGELQAYSSEFGIIDLTGLPLDDVKKRVATLPEKTAIFYTNIHKDGAA
jgi:hypothetical protein